MHKDGGGGSLTGYEIHYTRDVATEIEGKAKKEIGGYEPRRFKIETGSTKTWHVIEDLPGNTEFRDLTIRAINFEGFSSVDSVPIKSIRTAVATRQQDLRDEIKRIEATDKKVIDSFMYADFLQRFERNDYLKKLKMELGELIRQERNQRKAADKELRRKQASQGTKKDKEGVPSKGKRKRKKRKKKKKKGSKESKKVEEEAEGGKGGVEVREEIVNELEDDDRISALERPQNTKLQSLGSSRRPAQNFAGAQKRNATLSDIYNIYEENKDTDGGDDGDDNGILEEPTCLYYSHAHASEIKGGKNAADQANTAASKGVATALDRKRQK